MALAERSLELGEGLYTFPEAARILRNAVERVSATTLRRWTATGLVTPSHRASDGEPLLTFEDLISLEVIRRFRKDLPRPVSLPAIRKVEEELRTRYNMRRPFAYELFYTDGANVWVEILEDDESFSAIEIKGRNRNQVVWADVIRTFATQIEFGDHDRAEIWHPSRWVDINPSVQFGAPVVAGTRIPVLTISQQLRDATPEEIASWYDLELQQVHGVEEYLAVGA